LEEAQDMENLAQVAEVEDAAFSQKLLHENYSRKTRSRNERQTPDSSN
jgi:Ca-activated chloride channel family protein